MALKENTQYKWEPTDEFILTGTEFSNLYNTLNSIVNADVFQEEMRKAQQTFAIAEMYKLMLGKLVENQEKGIVKDKLFELLVPIIL